MTDLTTVRVNSPSHQAYQILQVGFVFLPLIAGIDKFFHFLVNWEIYLAPEVPRTLGITAQQFMQVAGAVEMGAALIVAFAPRIGGWIVGLWLCGIIINLLMQGAYFDVALRDFGLALGAFALARLGAEYSAT